MDITRDQRLRPLCGTLVDTSDDTVVTLERLEGQLLLGLNLLLAHLLDLLSEHNLGLGCAVNTVGLDGDNDTTSILEEHVGVQSDNTGLIGLGNIGKDDIDHGDEHTVTERVTGILNNGDDVGTVSGHADQITARAVRELDGVDVTSGSDNISDVRNGGTGGSTDVKNLGAGLHVDIIKTTQHTSSQLEKGEDVRKEGLNNKAAMAIGAILKNSEKNSMKSPRIPCIFSPG